MAKLTVNPPIEPPLWRIQRGATWVRRCCSTGAIAGPAHPSTVLGRIDSNAARAERLSSSTTRAPR